MPNFISEERDGTRIYYGKPVIYDENGENKLMYPNEARLRNFNYSFTFIMMLKLNLPYIFQKMMGQINM